MSDFTDFHELWNRVCDAREVDVTEHEHPIRAVAAAYERVETTHGGRFVEVVVNPKGFHEALDRYGLATDTYEVPILPVSDRDVHPVARSELAEYMVVAFHRQKLSLDMTVEDYSAVGLATLVEDADE